MKGEGGCTPDLHPPRFNINTFRCLLWSKFFASLKHNYTMRQFFRNPYAVFLIALLFVSTILFTIPINLFDGEITFNVGGHVFTEKAKLSLSYFIGIGASGDDLKDVESFRLVGMGYLLAGLLMIALPALIGYRVWIANQVEAQKKKQH